MPGLPSLSLNTRADVEVIQDLLSKADTEMAQGIVRGTRDRDNAPVEVKVDLAVGPRGAEADGLGDVAVLGVAAVFEGG